MWIHREYKLENSNAEFLSKEQENNIEKKANEFWERVEQSLKDAGVK